MSLRALVPPFLPAVPLDPFDGKELRYQTETNGYSFLSAGFVNDFGTSPDGTKEHITFKVVTPRKLVNP